MCRISEAKGYLIDVEGVLVRDKRYHAVPGSPEWFAALTDRGMPRVLVSNNTTHAPESLVEDLGDAGFDVGVDDIVSALAMGAGLLKDWGRTRIQWLGAPHLGDWWRDRGFVLVSAGPCDAVVLGVNPDLTVAQIDVALPALIDHDAELVALHRNLFWLDDSGNRRFGPGFYTSALQEAASREAVVVGKPKERIYREALKRVGIEAQDAVFISDDPVSDLVTAKRLGMGTAFVLSGKYSDHGVLAQLEQEDWPDVIADRPSDLTGHDDEPHQEN